MSDNAEREYLKWFKRAEEDYLSIRAILKGGGAFSTACFLSQQMAEKYLKGFLVFHNKSFPKVHDLIELETLLMEKTSDIDDLHKDLKLLNRYYIETRYPGDYPEFTFEEAQQSFESAIRIKEFVLKRII